MTSIDLDQLARVTGGVGCGAQPQQPQPQQPDDGAQPQQQPGGGFLAGIDQFLGMLQGQGFQQIIGGLRSMLGGQQQQPDQQQA